MGSTFLPPAGNKHANLSIRREQGTAILLD